MALIGALGLAYVASRSLAFERLFTEQLDSELRVRLFPQLWRMVWDYFPVGTGYGTFELAYKVSEPMEFLDLQYLNQAHNDLLQFLIEGGVAGAALLLVFGLWFVLRGWRAGARFISQSKARGSDPLSGTPAFRQMQRRIQLFLALPIESIDRMALKNRLGEIGRTQAEAPSG